MCKIHTSNFWRIQGAKVVIALSTKSDKRQDWGNEVGILALDCVI